jgi:hypothetical protein
MREQWRAVGMLARTAWRTDPWRSAGLLLEPVSQLALPFFAWFLKLMTDGVLRHDLRLAGPGRTPSGSSAATRRRARSTHSPT